MKHTCRTFLLFVLLSVVKSSSAQPDVAWTGNITGHGYDETFDVALDTSGNLFVCGQIEFTSHFGTYPLSTAGIHDIYLAKYSHNGNLLWAKREGGVGGDKAYSVGVDRAGNAYIVGEYEENFIFGNTHVVADAGNNMFIAKYDSGGVFKWVKTIQGGGETVRGYACAVDPDGNVYAGGVIRGDAKYNGTQLFATRGSTDVVFFKFNTSGHLVWSKRIGDTHEDDIWGLAVKDDKLYITGSFSTKTKFASTAVTASGDVDFYVAQYDTAGNFIWAKHAGGSTAEGLDVTVNGNNDVICSGYYETSATFSGTQLNAIGNTEAFLVSYDHSGNMNWVKDYGGHGFDRATGVVTDKLGNIYMTGTYEGVATFDSIHVTSSGGLDIFVSKCNANGHPDYVKSFGGPDAERGRSCAVDKYGNVFLNGEYWNYIYLDTNQLHGDTLLDAFVARIGSYPVCSATTAVTYPISCYNQCDGAATVAVSGLGPFAYQWTTAANQNADSVFNLCPGSYYVTVTDAWGCVAHDTVTFSQPSQIAFLNTSVSNASCSACADGYIDVTPAGGVPPYQYQWSNNTTAEDLVNVGTGSYQICITDSLGCVNCASYMIGVLGIEDVDLSNEVSISINDANSRIDIINRANTDFDYAIINVSGQKISGGEIRGGTKSIDDAFLSKGIYTIILHSSKGLVRRAFVKL
jgi:hypothetical protein